MSETNLTFTSGTVYVYGTIHMPSTTATTIENMTITGMALSTTAHSLGIKNNSQMTATLTTAHLSQFTPNFPWTKITKNGYTVAVSQSMQNETESQSSIISGNYIEQATYQGTFSLPTAPDLSYSETTITMNMSIPGTQFEVANLNGISYLSQIQTKTNGTFTFGTVNPNQQNSIILETKFTASQWNASTSAPSFFSVQGLEYYWWVGLIGLMSVIGLGAAASSHFSGEEENLKIPKGKFGR